MADEAKEKDEKGESESSGLADILEVAEQVGAGDSFTGVGITGDDDDDDDDDDLANFGAAASASLIADDDDDDVLPPAPPAPPASASTAGKTKPPPPPPKKTTPPAAPKAEAPKAAPKKEDSGVSVVPVAADSNPGMSEAALLVASAPKHTPAAAAAPEPDEGGNNKWWMIALGLAAVGAIVWFAVFRKTDPPPEKPVAEAKTETKIAKADPPPEPEPEPEPAIVEDASTGEATGTGGTGTGTGTGTGGTDDSGGDEEPVAVAKNDDWDATRKAKGIKKKTDNGPPPPDDGPPPPPPPEEDKKTADPFSKTDGKYSAECVLDPNKPGCEEYRRRQAAKLKDLDAHLSDKLSKAQIREGVNKVKGKAKACGATHGAQPDETVRVKLSIEGESGSVTSAEAQAPHAGTPLGDCVAKALEGATFDRFTSAVQGTTYPITF